MIASQNGHKETLKVLLEAKGDVSDKGISETTALSQIRYGMSMAEVIAQLGEPTATTNRQDAIQSLFGKNSVVVKTTDSSFQDSSASWVRPEGRYIVHFEHDCVVKASCDPHKPEECGR